MGAFYLVSASTGRNWRHVANSIHLGLEEQGFKSGHIVKCDNFVLGVFGKVSGNSAPNYVRTPGDQNFRFAAAVGTIFVDSQTGKPALETVLQRRKKPQCFGNYCLILGDDTTASISIDDLGLYKVYAARDASILCSSFLALAKSLPELTLDTQCLYEYVFQGATYGDRTVFDEIEILPPTCSVTITDSVVRSDSAPPEIPILGTDPSVIKSEILDTLSAKFRHISEAFGNQVDTALSGGYDSRLVLACLRQQGVVPSLHVYGKASDIDVITALQIASGEGYGIEHIDKSSIALADDLNRIYHRNHLLLDGLPTDGIFDNGSDIATRRGRAAGGRLALNGGGGEIFRNFFYLPDRSMRGRDLLHAFYCRFSKSTVTRQFCEKEYLRQLEDKVSKCFPHQEKFLRREEIEWLYPYFRCRYWMGRNNSVNNRFGYALTPLVDHTLSLLATGIPISFKNAGRFVSSLLNDIDKDLAKYPSAYGFDFHRAAPVSKHVSTYLNNHRPIWLRKRSFAIKRLLRRDFSVDSWMDSLELRAFLDADRPWTRKYFLHDRFRDEAQLQRIWTVEYLVRQLSNCSI